MAKTEINPTGVSVQDLMNNDSSLLGYLPKLNLSNTSSPFSIPNPGAPYGINTPGVNQVSVGGVPTQPIIQTNPEVPKSTTNIPQTIKAPETIKSSSPAVIGMTDAEVAAKNAAADANNLLRTNPQPLPSTPGSVSSLYTAPVNPDQVYIDNANSILNNIGQEVDPQKLYQQNLSNYQSQIDTINTLYADKLNQARIQGQGRIQSRQFAQGRSGQIGSGTGEAGINAVQDANTEVYNSIEAERKNALAEIETKVRTGASDLLKANTEAKTLGAKALLDFYNVQKPAIKAKNLSTAVKALIAKGIDINTMTPEEIKSFTDGIGITKDELISAYSSEKTSVAKAKQDADKELAAITKTKAETDKLNAEIAQGKWVTIGDGATIYNSTTGKTITNPKTFAPTTEKVQKNYDSKTITQDIKTNLFADLKSNSSAKKKDKKTLNDFISAYPEVDTEYLTKVYEANQ